MVHPQSSKGDAYSVYIQITTIILVLEFLLSTRPPEVVHPHSSTGTKPGGSLPSAGLRAAGALSQIYKQKTDKKSGWIAPPRTQTLQRGSSPPACPHWSSTCVFVENCKGPCTAAPVVWVFLQRRAEAVRAQGSRHATLAG